MRERRSPPGLRAEPIHYPDAAVICGTPGCTEPGLVWLNGLEAIEFSEGKRLCFPLTGERHLAKLTVRPRTK